MAHRVTRRVHALELDALADLDDVAGLDPSVYARDEPGGAMVRDHLGAGGRHHGRVAADVVVVLVGVQDLGDLPALDPGGRQCLFMVQRVDCKSFPGVRAGHQVVEVAQRVAGPDSLDDHWASFTWATADDCRRMNSAANLLNSTGVFKVQELSG